MVTQFRFDEVTCMHQVGTMHVELDVYADWRWQ
jgi:hypothetical protein